MLKTIDKQMAINNLEQGDIVTIPSGLGGSFTVHFDHYVSDTNKAEVTILCKGSDYDGLTFQVVREAIGFPVIAKDTITDAKAVAVRDSAGKQYIAFTERDHSFSAQAEIPNISPYRDKQALIKGLSNAVLARRYVHESESFVKQRYPDANSFELNRLITQVEQGVWVAPERIETAIRDAGTFYDLTFWIDAEQSGPIPPTWLPQCISDLYVATKSPGLNIDSDPADQDYRESPIVGQKGIKEATKLALLYMNQRNYGDEVEIRSSSECDVSFVLAGDLLLIVENDCWHKEFLRPFCKANEQWLDEKRSRFDITHSVSEFMDPDQDPLASPNQGSPSLC